MYYKTSIMSINTVANTSLLMQILKNHPLLKKDGPRQFHEILGQHINEIHQNRFTYNSDLIAMNKELLRRFTTISNYMVKKPQQEAPVNNKLVPATKNFETRLKEQQDSFLKLANPPKPTEIDFSDNVDEGAIATVDSTLLQREKELRAILSDYKDAGSAEKWIGNKKPSPEKTAGNITIGEKTNLSIKPDLLPAPQKRVTFAVTESNPAPSFLSKLKKKIKRDDDIAPNKEPSQEMWNEMLAIQKNILDVQKKILVQLEKT